MEYLNKTTESQDLGGLPCWSSVQESTCHSVERSLDLWSGKILCAIKQLGPCATSTEARAP